MLPIIVGISGHQLTNEEREFFRASQPFGYILFKRNIETPEQVKALTDELRAIAGRQDVPVLLDQEGARVQKLRPPHWLDMPSMRMIGDLYAQNAEHGLEAVRLHARITAAQMHEIGCNTVCAPVLDVPVEGADEVIGDRAFSRNVDHVMALGRAMIDEYLACGITPVAKHAPGHGRATADTHVSLPVVQTSMDELQQTDFKAFSALPTGCWVMMAHVAYTALEDKPASQSATAIQAVRQLGVQGPIITDAIEMNALSGSLAARAKAALDAGCDVVLYAADKLDEMQQIAAVVPMMTEAVQQRFAQASALCQKSFAKTDWRSSYEQLKAILGVTDIPGFASHEVLNAA